MFDTDECDMIASEGGDKSLEGKHVSNMWFTHCPFSQEKVISLGDIIWTLCVS